MTLGLAVFFTNRMEWMLAVLFLMALHSTVFSPAKYGFVPELLDDKDLSRANGLLEMTTFVAIVLGTSIGSFLFAYWKGEAWKMGVVMVGVAIAGLAVSFGIPRTGTSAHRRQVPMESDCGSGCRRQAPAARQVAVADRGGHFVFLDAGGVVSTGPVFTTAARCCT